MPAMQVHLQVGRAACGRNRGGNWKAATRHAKEATQVRESCISGLQVLRQRRSMVNNYALGCMIGAAVGDAAGGTLEFYEEVNDADVKTALTMPGGGFHQLGPGQVTDDTELAMCLGRGLLAGLGMESVARAYSAWIQSSPFDIGRTCRTAMTLPTTADTAGAMVKAAQASLHSKANGALMRIHPAIVYGSKFPDDELVKLVQADARLSHPNPTVLAASACYAVAVARLLRQPGDSCGAYRAALDRATCPEVRGWLLNAWHGRLDDVRQQEGFVKWGFTLAFTHLLRRTAFEEALRDTLARGGDSDTNACIVGGMMGALWGVARIPPSLKEPVLHFDPTGDRGRRRPAWLSPSLIPQMCRDLWDKQTAVHNFLTNV